MATIRRLSDADVKAVFDCVHNDIPPPANLSFQIVNVGPTGLKLSPPSYEFEDGLYILLKPIKKKGKKEIEAAKRADPRLHPSIPSNLVDLVMTEFPTEACPWSLSGPQFPQPTAIQQRYCYPKGDPEYSSRKGGALWTMYLENGKEDLEYRLLHVYFSAKRATNKGVEVPEDVVMTPKRQQSPRKRQKKMKKKKSRADPNVMPSLGSPAADSIDSSVGSSPLSFQVPPPLPSKDVAHSKPYESGKFITPEKEDGFPDGFHPVQFAEDGRSGGVSVVPNSHHHNMRPKHSIPYQYAVGYSPGVARRERGPGIPHNSRSYQSEPRTPNYPYPVHQMTPQSAYDPFNFEGDSNLFDMDSSSWPFTSPAGKPPAQGFPTPESRDAVNDPSTQQDRIQTFATKLDGIHDSIKDMIHKANESDQGYLVNVTVRWAKKVAQGPMGTGTAAIVNAPTANNPSTRRSVDGGGFASGNGAYPQVYGRRGGPWPVQQSGYHSTYGYCHQAPSEHQSPMVPDDGMNEDADQKAAV